MSNKKSIPKYQYGGPGYFTSGNANIGEGTKQIAQWILKGLGKVGDAFNTMVTAGASTDFGQTSPFVFGTGEERRNIANAREHTRQRAKETIVKAAPIISPSSHIVAWTNGSLNPYKGAKIIGQADPRLQVLAAGADIATFAKGPRIVKEGVPAVLERTSIGRSKASLPNNYAYRITMPQEVEDIAASGSIRRMPEGVEVERPAKKPGRFNLHKAGGNSHGGKAFAAGEPWHGNTSGTSSNMLIGVPGTNSMWQVGHHGNYSQPMRFGDIKQGSGLWVKFGEDGQTGISTEGLKTWEILPNGRYKRVDPLKVRQQRLQNKKDAGIIPETTQTTIVRDGEPTAQIEQDLVNAYKKLGIEEPDARAMAKYTIANNNEGIHTPVTDDYGNLIGGVSYVDKQKAIAMLKKSGVKNPTEEDIKTIIAHEEGHQVETPGADKEFYTQMGQVLDNEGITAANPNMTLDSMLASIDRYLKQGKLDNGISARKEQILDMPINTANRVIANINRFSGGTGVAYLLSDKKDKIDINNLG